MALALAACAGAPVSDAPINRDSLRALRWIAPGADIVRALTSEPVSCRIPLEPVSRVEVIANGVTYSNVDLGKIAFESPALLGGAAGRMGLSCASCHINGRDNPDFFLEGVSGAPGTADVTNSLFSKSRGNGAFDPTPIPDLAARDGKQMKIRKGDAFKAKTHGLIVEEFDGQEPPEQMLYDVIAYMDGLAVCADPAARQPLSAQKDMETATTAFWIAWGLAPEGRRIMARAARERLERLHERFVGAGQADVRAALLEASRAIGAWMEAPDAAGEKVVTDALALAAEQVKREQGRSLYNPETLRVELARAGLLR